MGYVSFFENFIQIVVLLFAWLVVLLAFFILAIQLFVTLIEFKLTTLAGFVLIPFGLFGKTAFLAERVLGNVVSSGVKVLVLAVIVGIGSTLFAQFTAGFGGSQPIDRGCDGDRARGAVAARPRHLRSRHRQRPGLRRPAARRRRCRRHRPRRRRHRRGGRRCAGRRGAGRMRRRRLPAPRAAVRRSPAARPPPIARAARPGVATVSACRTAAEAVSSPLRRAAASLSRASKPAAGAVDGRSGGRRRGHAGAAPPPDRRRPTARRLGRSA